MATYPEAFFLLLALAMFILATFNVRLWRNLNPTALGLALILAAGFIEHFTNTP